MNVTGIGITKPSTHVENARLLIEFLVAQAGQKMFADLDKEYPLHPEVKADPALIPDHAAMGLGDGWEATPPEYYPVQAEAALGFPIEIIAGRDAVTGEVRWSYTRDFDTQARLVVVDSRAARQLDPDDRAMLVNFQGGRAVGGTWLGRGALAPSWVRTEPA